MLLGVLGVVCVCCAMRSWGRVRKLPYLTKYRKQLSDERNRLMADGNVPKKEKVKRVEKLDQKIDETDQVIGRLASDSAGEAETELNAPGIGRVISKSSSTEERQEAVEGGGEGVVMVDIEPGREDKR